MVCTLTSILFQDIVSRYHNKTNTIILHSRGGGGRLYNCRNDYDQIICIQLCQQDSIATLNMLIAISFIVRLFCIIWMSRLHYVRHFVCDCVNCILFYK